VHLGLDHELAEGASADLVFIRDAGRDVSRSERRVGATLARIDTVVTGVRVRVTVSPTPISVRDRGVGIVSTVSLVKVSAGGAGGGAGGVGGAGGDACAAMAPGSPSCKLVLRRTMQVL